MSILSKLTWSMERALYAAGAAGARIERARQPRATTVRQLQTFNESRWSVDEIQDALETHEEGIFTDSARLAAAIGRDDRIIACRNTRTRALTGRTGPEFSVVPSGEGDERRSEQAVADVRQLWPKVIIEPFLTRALSDAIDLGPSISRIHWVRSTATRKQWVPVLEPYAMEWVRWDHSIGRYLAQTEQGEVEVTPNTGEWLIVEPNGAQSWMGGAIRSLGMLWFFRGMTWKDWARYCEKHGVPILAIDEPSGERATTTGSGGSKANFYASLKKLGREGLLRLPRSSDGKSGYGAKILEPKSLSWPAFEAFLKRVDTCIAIHYLGQNLSTEVSSGSFAAAKSQNRVRLDYLSADAQTISTAVREQVWMWWGRFNFDWWDDALTPWGIWDTSEAEDQKARAGVIASVSRSLAQFKTSSTTIVDERALLEQFGIPLLPEGAQAPKQET